jgi:hypothetical protein
MRLSYEFHFVAYVWQQEHLDVVVHHVGSATRSYRVHSVNLILAPWYINVPGKRVVG